jgi:hypothetical protein
MTAYVEIIVSVKILDFVLIMRKEVYRIERLLRKNVKIREKIL